jgi:EmrB/QacA subfamily drug resistance transporter
MSFAPQSSRWLSPLIVSFGVLAGQFDTSVNIAFPAITAAFAIEIPTIQWIVICYVLTYASLLLGCGRLGDVFGHKRVLLAGLLWSALSFYLCGRAPTFGWLLVCRGMQGLGHALVLSCAPALVTLAFPEAERGKALGLYTMFAAVAATLGPLLGGPLVTLWGWPAVFYFRVPMAVLAALLTIGWVRQPVAITPGQRFDGLGAVTLTTAIAGLLLALNQGNRMGWLTLPTLGAGSAALSCFGLFIWHTARCAEPVIDLRLFQHAGFSLANLAHILVSIASFSVLLLVPYYLLNTYHVSALVGGVLLAMSPLGSMLASPLGGRLLTQVAPRRLSLLGAGLVAAGLLGIGQWQTSPAMALVAGVLLVQGFGQGLFQVANMDFVMGMIPRQHQGVAGSLTMLTRAVGIVAGATLGAFLLGLLQTHYMATLGSMGVAEAHLAAQAFLHAFQGAFHYAAGLAVLAGVLLWSSRFT